MQGFGKFAAASARTVAMALETGLLAAAAHAGPVVVNGNFETVTAAASTEFGDRFGGQVVTGWTTGGYNFLFKPGTADTSGAVNEYGQQLKLWGPGVGAGNGLPMSSPAGGNFLGADGVYFSAPIQQTVTGLIPGGMATVTFDWAGAQQYGFDGPTSEGWVVSLGGETHTTPVLQDANHGFTGWQAQSLSFAVTSPSEVLSFLAVGTPAGEPPFSLLDGVSVTEAPIPEPASLALVGGGLGIAGMLACRRQRRGIS